MTGPFLGALLNSALYLVCVFVAALLWHADVAAKVAIVALGVTYLSHLCVVIYEFDRTRANSYRIATAFVWLSIIAGTGAGLLLLFGV